MVWTYLDYVISTKSISTKFWRNTNHSVSPKFWTKSKLIAEIPHGTFSYDLDLNLKLTPGQHSNFQK